MRLPRAALVGVISAALCLLLAVAAWWSTAERPSDGSGPDGPAPTATAAEVLRAWDRDRSAAWAAGDVEALRALYASDAPVGRRDATMLERYVERGLVVEGLTTQLVAVEEVHLDDDTWVLEVEDRVHAGTVVGAGVRRALPRDSTDRRRLTLRRHGEQWRMVSVVRLPADGSDRSDQSGGQSG